MLNSQLCRRSTLHFISPAEWAILDLLLEREPEDPHTVGEIARAIGNVALLTDALATLETAGLIRRCGQLVRLTPASQIGE
jgi:DNA-binding MarR family transcriptional regulator